MVGFLVDGCEHRSGLLSLRGRHRQRKGVRRREGVASISESGARGRGVEARGMGMCEVRIEAWIRLALVSVLLISVAHELFLLSEKVIPKCSPTRPRVGTDGPGTDLRASVAER